MGFAELRAIQFKKIGKIYEEDHAAIKPSGPKPKKPLRQVGLEKQKENRQTAMAGREIDKKALDLWFHNIQYSISPGTCHCWECNAYIPAGFIGCATAHIFPKKDFYSVRTHESNYLILGAGCCHDKSHKINSFKKMGIWRDAVDRFLLFEHLLTEKEKSLKYYTLFRDAAKESFPNLF
jgi:hypothetical protein